MADDALKTSTRADAAQSRIEKALARLEKAIENRPAATTDEGPDPVLAEKLDAAHREIASLKDRNHQVSTRLDKAIERMKSALGSEA